MAGLLRGKGALAAMKIGINCDFGFSMQHFRAVKRCKLYARKLGIEIMKYPRLTSLKSVAFFLTLLWFASLPFVSNARADSGPFAGLAGNWSGSGTISLGNGSRESIRCRAQYSVSAEGNDLQQSLRCASDSYRFDLSSNVVAQGGQLSGNWTESSRNMSGLIMGNAKPGQFQVIVTSPSFSANLSLTTRGDRQVVEISAPPGGQFTGVSITLARGK
jgi:hypothetical protein